MPKIQYLKNLLLLLTVICMTYISVAQEATAKVQMADQFYKEGKIYIVVLVVVSILIGIFFYLFSLDKKIKKLEKETDN